MTPAYWETPANPTAIRTAMRHLRTYAGFDRFIGGGLVRTRGDERTYVRMQPNGHARVIMTAPGFRARIIVKCGGYLYADDIEQSIRNATDDQLPNLHYQCVGVTA